MPGNVRKPSKNGRKDAAAVPVEQIDLSVVFNSVDEMILVIDDHSNIVQINDSMARKLSISAGEAVGRKCYELIHGTNSPPSFCPHARMLKDKLPHEGSYFDNKTKRQMKASVHPFVKDGRYFSVHVLKDITDQKHSEDDVREMFSKYRAIIDNLGIGISLLDQDMRILEMSRQMKIWFPNINIGDKPLCYRAFNNPPRSEPCDYCPTIKTLQDGTVHEAVTHTPSPFGVINYRIVSSPVINPEGRIVGAVEIVEDITERMVFQEKVAQSEKLESIGRLATGIAHDFNNMIQVVISAAEFAAADIRKNLNVESYLNDILEAARHSADFTRQLLAFGRKQFVQPQNIDLNRKIQDSLKIIRKGIPDNIHIDFVPYESLNRVYADPVQIEQVLLNLCMNAKDAMPKGGYIRVTTENAYLDKDDCIENPNARPGVYAMMVISDTGKGIPQDEISHIFEPFFTTKLASRGTGLGLATVYGIVQQHKGIVEVSSEVSKGTTFRIYLPSANQAVVDVDEKIEEANVKGGSETILLVEDDFPVHKLMKTILEQAGYNIFSAADGEEAMNILVDSKNSIDLALIDVVLPKFSGKEIAEKIIAKWPRTRILFTTGYSKDVVLPIAQTARNVGIMEKPFRKSDLLKNVRNLLDRKA